MHHYNYQNRLKEIWDQAVHLYKSGNKNPSSYFDATTLDELASIGLNTMDIYDYAEDYVGGGDPSLETFLMICEARRDYFLTEQKSQLSTQRLNASKLPSKDSEARGITWLPRIIPKALAKLRGELPPETMYCCGGDRHFLKTNDIHPAEFLRAVWAYQDEQEKIIDWVEARRKTTS